MDDILLSTHLQAFFFDADHHPRGLTLHAEAHVQKFMMVLGLSVLPRPLIDGGGQAVGLRRGEVEGQAGAPGSNSRPRMRTGVTQDGELWRQHALQRIHHICKSQIVISYYIYYISYEEIASAAKMYVCAY